ncbi:MAG: hypothetical protein J6K85_01725 [Clostridia bacterium]|nr:hypothetical protein [Clostridia bacterium]
MKRKITALILCVLLILSCFCSCDLIQPDNNDVAGNQPCEHCDKNDDYLCDYCSVGFNDGEDCTNHRDKNDDGRCDYCLNSFSDGNDGASNCTDHRDKNDDGICDYCNRRYEDGSDCTHRDKNDDGVCDYCGSTHYDGNDVTDDDWNDCTHQDENDDGVCDYCGKAHSDGCNHNNFATYEVFVGEPGETNCLEGAHVVYKVYCSNCDAYLYTNEYDLNAAGHSTEYGKNIGTCLRCGAVDPGVTIDPSLPYTVAVEGGKKFVFMGEYPQQLKAKDVTIVSGPNDKNYYLGSDNNYYAKYVAKNNGYNENKFQNGESIIFGQEYYFKVAPIRWEVVSEESGKAMLVCDSIIDVLAFQDQIKYNENGYAYVDIYNVAEDVPANTYYHSLLRKWLNDSFYNQAFNASQQQVILTTTVGVNENAATHNKYHQATEDKIFVSSGDEGAIGENGYLTTSRRELTDFLRAKGFGSTFDQGEFTPTWLRDPVVGWASFNNEANCLSIYTDYSNPYDVTSERGVIPVMYISFN